MAVAFAGCGGEEANVGGSAGTGGVGGVAGIGDDAGSGGAGGTTPTTFVLRIVHMNATVGLIDVTDAGDPDTVIVSSFEPGSVTAPFTREAGTLSFDCRGPGGGDLRFSTQPQAFEAGKDYVLILLPDPSSMMSNANQTVTIEIERDAVGAGEAGLVLVHGSDDPTFEIADINLAPIVGDVIGMTVELETDVGIGTRTSIQSLAPGDYGFALLFESFSGEDSELLTGRRALGVGEFVIAIAGTADVTGWFALDVESVTGRDFLQPLPAAL